MKLALGLAMIALVTSLFWGGLQGFAVAASVVAGLAAIMGARGAEVADRKLAKAQALAEAVRQWAQERGYEPPPVEDLLEPDASPRRSWLDRTR